MKNDKNDFWRGENLYFLRLFFSKAAIDEFNAISDFIKLEWKLECFLNWLESLILLSNSSFILLQQTGGKWRQLE